MWRVRVKAIPELATTGRTLAQINSMTCNLQKMKGRHQHKQPINAEVEGVKLHKQTTRNQQPSPAVGIERQINTAHQIVRESISLINSYSI